VDVSADSPGAYPGALSALSASAAVYIDCCSPCGYGTGPWDLVTGDGATLTRERNVGDLNQPLAASFSGTNSCSRPCRRSSRFAVQPGASGAES